METKGENEMIYLTLFLSFLKIGAFTFGGGYAMISIIRETVLSHGWMTEEALLNFIAVAESTPGPVAVNMATFIGSSQGGFWGAVVATLGVVLPSFLIILVIAALIRNFLKYKAVNAFLDGVRPCVIAMILATSLTIGLSTVFSFQSIGDIPTMDVSGIFILIALFAVHFVYQKLTRKKPSPILMILLSAGLGMLLHG